MKVEGKKFPKDKKYNYNTTTLYQLDGWAKDDWMYAENFLSELINSEAEYQVIPKKDLEKSDMDLRNKIIDVFKDNKDEGLSKEEVFDRIRLNHYTEEDFEKELIKLLEDGFIFEAKPSKFRWLG